MRKLTTIIVLIALFLMSDVYGQKNNLKKKISASLMQKIKNTKKQKPMVISPYKIADSIFGQLNQRNIPSAFLLNRTLIGEKALAFNTNKYRDSIVDGNDLYRLYAEFRKMALDSSKVPTLMDIYHDANSFMGKMSFEKGITVYPIGIFDMKYEWIDLKKAMRKGRIERKKLQFFDVPGNQSIYHHKAAQMIAPLLTLQASDNRAFIFRKEDFFSNYHSPSDVKNIVLTINGKKRKVQFDKIYNFSLENNQSQSFLVKLTYKNGEVMENHCKISAPFSISQPNKISESSSFTETHPPLPTNFRKCEYMGTVVQGVNKLKFCYIKGCNNYSSGFRPKKPFILVAGWRPPVFGKGFKGLWKTYNSNHNNLLMSLISNNYDVIMVRFNIQQFPRLQGIPEQAGLFKEFLEFVNERKGGGNFHENVIMAASMGASVVRMALLEMEKKHLDNPNYPHHRTRLFIPYDANFYGANIPLAYQYQIYSSFYHLDFSFFVQGAPVLLLLEMTAALEAKSTKELLMYHAKDTAHPNVFKGLSHTQQYINVVPTHNYRRSNYLNHLNSDYSSIKEYYNTHPNQYNEIKQDVLPMPISTRNIAISLGRHNGTDNNDQKVGQYFKYAGQTWTDYNIHLWGWVIEDHYLRAANYTSNFQYLFTRKYLAFTGWLFPFPHIIADHKVKVKYMQEIDNAPGSYLKGGGNLVDVSNLIFPRLLNPVNKNRPRLFTHKSVFSALAINPEYWPSNGSHSRDMQYDLKLMYNNFNFSQTGPSDYYGYPNLGQPNNHWDITPFEAVFLGNKVLPHIDLEDAEQPYLNKINNFIRNEVEPWYLYLQNDHLGAQARSNYTYKSFRRAKYSIVTGKQVTPKTDPGNYVVEPNASIIMHAGEQIDLKPGTHIKAGATAHLKIQYISCSHNKIMQSSTQPNGDRAFNKPAAETENSGKQRLQEESNLLAIFPNPSKNYFTVVSKQEIPITAVRIYDLSGHLMIAKKHLYITRYRLSNTLAKGVYIVSIITKGGKRYTKKLVVL